VSSCRATNAKALLEGGLTQAAVVALLQARIPRKRKDRPFPEADIIAVLEAAARLHEFVREQEPKKARRP